MNVLARDLRQIGSAIRRSRREKGFTQATLGDKAGLRQKTISQIERGSQSARIGSLLAVFAALDLELQIAPRAKTWDPEAFL
jgi:HTH-type transcriptional regulator / antitoxin HipB